MSGMMRRTIRVVFFLLLGAAALANSGCLAALVTGGAAGAAGYAYYRGNVNETFDGDFTTVWHATHDALYDLGMPVTKESRDALSGTIDSVNGQGERVRVHIDQELPPVPTDRPTTQVGVRVATFGDQGLSRRILQQIAVRANPPQQASAARTTPASPAVPTTPPISPASLQAPAASVPSAPAP